FLRIFSYPWSTETTTKLFPQFRLAILEALVEIRPRKGCRVGAIVSRLAILHPISSVSDHYHYLYRTNVLVGQPHQVSQQTTVVLPKPKLKFLHHSLRMGRRDDHSFLGISKHPYICLHQNMFRRLEFSSLLLPVHSWADSPLCLPQQHISASRLALSDYAPRAMDCDRYPLTIQRHLPETPTPIDASILPQSHLGSRNFLFCILLAIELPVCGLSCLGYRESSIIILV
ncbi:hypothetical protein C8J56DRAFT_171571, partial [Mycena floridula]